MGQKTENIDIGGRNITVICNKFMPVNTMFVSEDLFNDLSGRTEEIQEEKIKKITDFMDKHKTT